MPWGIYKKGEEFKIYYSACDETLSKSEEGEKLIATCKIYEDAKFGAELLGIYESILKDKKNL